MTTVDGTAAPLERAERLVLLYDKLLVLRLAHLAQALAADGGEHPGRARFLERWSSVERMHPAGLLRALRDPHVAGWVATGEELIRNGIYERYPDAHPSRHLDAFGRLVLSWAGALPDGSRGQVELAGDPAVDLMFGDAVLLGPMADAHRRLSWRRDGDRLRIGWSDAEPILEASLSDPATVDVAGGGWRCLSKPRAGSIGIDVWTWPRGEDDLAAVDPRPLHDAVSRAAAGVRDELRPLLAFGCRTVTAGAANRRWIAGLVPLRDPAALTPRALVELSCFDLVNRLVFVGSASEPMRPPRPVLAELARRMSARLHGDDPGSGIDPAVEARWGALVCDLYRTNAALDLWTDLEEAGPPANRSPAEPAPARDLMLPLGDVGVPEVPRPLVLKKTRRSAASSVNDFTALNALSYVPVPVLREVLGRALADAAGSEDAAYLAAAAAYVAGDFGACARALAHSLRFDPDVEEYWHLLAFALRFLNRYDEFNAIMFGGVRNAGMLERFEPPGVRTA